MANDPYIQSFTCFDGTRRLLTAALPEVALALKQAAGLRGGDAGAVRRGSRGFAERIAGWPTDVREHAAWLASDGES
ncbi:hypothetical protein Z046_07235 [Pseudomonas aeruginosa VRFPA09]|nr:hypothetical protein Z046_07235 [Pseudomonas aeruginosa VRFPA09]